MTKNTKFLLLTIAFWGFCGAALQMSYQRNSWLQNDSLFIGTDEIRARDSGGLKLYDDAGTAGLFVEDAGQIGMGTLSPDAKLELVGSFYQDAVANGANDVRFYYSKAAFNTIYGRIIHTGDSEGLTIENVNNSANRSIVFKNGSSASTTERMRVNTDGKIQITGDSVTIKTSQSPASSDACDTGEIAWDTGYIYICTSSGAWKRAALTGGY